MLPKITEKKTWNMRSIKSACIDNYLYTLGTEEDFDKMLRLADSLEPTAENIYLIAKDINEHSDGETIKNIMSMLSNRAVVTSYEIREEAIMLKKSDLKKHIRVWCWWKSRCLFYTGRIICNEYEFVDIAGASTMITEEQLTKLEIRNN